MSVRGLGVAIAVVLIAAVVAGCGDSGESVQSSGETQPAQQGGEAPDGASFGEDLWNREFVVVTISGNGARPPIRKPIEMRVSFSTKRDGAVGWQARCNSFFGSVTITATRLEVGSAGGTEIGCEPPAQKEDEWLTGFMQADPRWRLDGERVLLDSGGVTLTLRDF